MFGKKNNTKKYMITADFKNIKIIFFMDVSQKKRKEKNYK